MCYLVLGAVELDFNFISKHHNTYVLFTEKKQKIIHIRNFLHHYDRLKFDQCVIFGCGSCRWVLLLRRRGSKEWWKVVSSAIAFDKIIFILSKHHCMMMIKMSLMMTMMLAFDDDQDSIE